MLTPKTTFSFIIYPQTSVNMPTSLTFGSFLNMTSSLTISSSRSFEKNKTGTLQDGNAISKAKLNSKGDPLETKKFRKNVAQCRKKSKGGPFSPVRFYRLRLKSTKPDRGPFGITSMRFTDTRLVSFS